VRFDLEVDYQVARRSAVGTLPALAREPQPGSAVGTRRYGDVHRAARARLSRAVARGTTLGGHLSPAEAHRTGAVHREAALPERDHAAPAALRAGLERRARRGAAAVAGGTLLVHLELDGHLSTQRRGAEGDLDRGLH